MSFPHMLDARRWVISLAAVIAGVWIMLPPAGISASSMSTVSPLNSPLLSLATFASPLRGVDAGARITYTLVVSNVGSMAAPQTFISSTLPHHTTFLSTEGDFDLLTFVSPLQPDHSIEWSLGALAANGLQVKTITLVVSVREATPTYSRIRLQSTAHADGAVSATSVITHVVNQTVAPVTPSAGGHMDNGRIVLDFPPAAVTRTVDITFTSLTTPTANARTMREVGRTFTLEARDSSNRPVTHFQHPYTLTLHYTDADVVASGLNESRLNLYFYDRGVWLPILPCAGCRIDVQTNTVTVALDHFTEFALGASSSVYLPAIIR